MPRTVSCFTNACEASGVWTAVERVREAGINHLELALRPHNFGGLVIPESAVITEQAEEATARSFVDHPDRCGVTISGCNIGGADLRTTRSTKIGMRAGQRACLFYPAKVWSGRQPPSRQHERIYM